MRSPVLSWEAVTRVDPRTGAAFALSPNLRALVGFALLMPTAREKFQTLLKKLFQFDCVLFFSDDDRDYLDTIISG